MPFESVYDYSYGGIMRSYEDSLQRLGLARIDILYVHDIGRLTHGDGHPRAFAELDGGGFRALQELRASGAIAGFGLGVNEWEVCLEAMAVAISMSCCWPAAIRFLSRERWRRFLPACVERAISVVIGGAYNSGILATGTRGRETPLYDYAPAPAPVLERVRRLEAVCNEFDVPLAAAALQFPLAHPAVVSVIPGLGSVARVAQTIDLYRTEIPPGFWSGFARQGSCASRRAAAGRCLMRVDAHHHLWHPARGDYGWLTPDLTALYRAFEAEDLQPLLKAAEIDATILVQAAPTDAETDYLLAIAQKTPWIAGVVGWTDLAAPDAPARVARLAQSPRLVGLRPMLQDLPDPNWILRAEAGDGLSAMAAHGLVFDALVRESQLPAIVQLAKRFPDAFHRARSCRQAGHRRTAKPGLAQCHGCAGGPVPT